MATKKLHSSSVYVCVAMDLAANILPAVHPDFGYLDTALLYGTESSVGQTIHLAAWVLCAHFFITCKAV